MLINIFIYVVPVSVLVFVAARETVLIEGGMSNDNLLRRCIGELNRTVRRLCNIDVQLCMPPRAGTVFQMPPMPPRVPTMYRFKSFVWNGDAMNTKLLLRVDRSAAAVYSTW